MFLWKGSMQSLLTFVKCTVTLIEKNPNIATKSFFLYLCDKVDEWQGKRVEETIGAKPPLQSAIKGWHFWLF